MEEKDVEIVAPKAEENPAEVAPESTNENVDNLVELTKYTGEEKSYLEVVEEARSVIVSQNKKSTRLSTISMALVFICAAAGFIMLGINQIVSFVCLGVAIVLLITFSIIIKRIASPDVKTYVNTASVAISRFVFNDGQYTDCKYDKKGKIEFSDICEDGLYNEPKETVSRFLVTGKFLGRTFKTAELGIYKAIVKRRKPTCFVGKYLTFPNDLHFVDRIVIVSKGETEIDIPDGLDGLVECAENDRFSIYAPEGCDAKKVLGNKFIESIKDIEVKNHLLTLCVVVWAGRSIVYASYDEDTVTLPFMKKAEETCFIQYRNDTLKELEALNMLVKE